MTTFLLISLLSLLFALACVLIPLWRSEQTKGSLAMGFAFVVFLPLATAILYAIIGQPQALSRATSPADELRGQLIAIADDLERQPDNHQGWFAMGMAYKSLEAFSSAEHALRRALYLDPTNSTVSLELAETLFLSDPSNTPDEAVALLTDTVSNDETNQRAWWLLGVVAFSNERYSQAIQHWQQLLTLVPANASVRSTIERQLDLAKQREAGMPEGRQADLYVGVASSLREGLNGTETVFIIAQAVDGPPTPLAARRLTVADLPTHVVLSDADAMIEGLNLSSASQLKVTARISLTGDPIAKPGDLQGQVVLTDTLEADLIIDTVLD